jgi:hypothetical protein
MRGGKIWRLGGVLALIAASAWADPESELTAAIGLYEAKKSEQAVKALRAVVSSSEATAAVRARAHLYIGLALSKLGENVGATAAFADAFQLDPSLTIPFGTSPKIAARAEVVRAETKAKLEARADMSEWASPTGLPPPPLPPAESAIPAAPPPIPPAQDPAFSAPPLPIAEAAPLPPPTPAPFVGPVLPAPEPLPAPPLPAPTPIVRRPPAKVEPENPDDGPHFGLGMRFIYDPVDDVVGPGGELTFGMQKGGRQLGALFTLYPGRQVGVGGALRVLFGPVIKRWRIEFGFDLGVIIYPSRLQVAFEVSTQVLGFSFPVGPVRVKIKLLTAGLYGNFVSNPIVVLPALGAGFGVEY